MACHSARRWTCAILFAALASGASADRIHVDEPADAGAAEALSPFARAADTTPPVSNALALPPILTMPAFDIAWIADDPGGSVDHVVLRYRRNGGAWTEMADSFTSSPIHFDTTRFSGDGFYRFYTVATDVAGNTEAAPSSADTTASVVTSFAGPRVYVDLDAKGNRTGLDWSNAIRQIASGLLVAQTFGVREVWVAEGTYHEAIVLPGGVELYGGFAGTEQALAERDFAGHVSVLDAWRAVGEYSALHAVVMERIQNSRIDGFQITSASDSLNMPGQTPTAGGAVRCVGVDATNTIANCTISGNWYDEVKGAGIYFEDASPRLAGCLVCSNHAGEGSGGGMYCLRSSPALTGCVVNSNSARYGGGLYCQNSSPSITDGTVDRNKGEISYYGEGEAFYYGDGGGMYCVNSSPSFQRCSVSSNTAAWDGGGMRLENSSPSFSDCQIAGNACWNGWAPTNGGLSCSGGWPSFVNVRIEGNRSEMGALGFHGSSPVFANCSIVGNNGESGGVIDFSGGSPQLSNCLIARNGISYDPIFAPQMGVVVCDSASARIVNCTVVGNTIDWWSGGGGHGSSIKPVLCCMGSVGPTIVNTLFAGNQGWALWSDTNLVVRNCLFDGNGDGDIYDHGTGWTGAADINAHVPGASGNVDGDPAFPRGPSGVWTDSQHSNIWGMILTDASASFTPNELVGKFIRLSPDYPGFVKVIANTATTITAPDFTDPNSVPSLVGHTYQIYDDANIAHLGFGSAAIDAGIADGAPATDLDGAPRPVDIPGLGADGTGTEFDIGAYEAPAPRIHVYAPQFDDSCPGGSAQEVRWTASGTIGPAVAIELRRNSAGFHTTLAASVPSDASALPWTVPDGLPPATDYNIKVRSLTSGLVFGYSAPFTIPSPAGSVSVFRPGAGARCPRGSTFRISWTATGDPGAQLDIDLFKGTGAGAPSWPLFRGSNAARGYRSWTIPWSLPNGSDYRIKITSQSDPTIFDYSEAFGIAGGLAAPDLVSVADAGVGDALLRWSNPGDPPAQFLGFAWDIYSGQWAPAGADGSMWFPTPPLATSGTLVLAQSGAYHAWISSQYPAAWLPCLNPWTGILYSGTPHPPLDAAAQFVAGRDVRLTWRPEIYGTWHCQIIAYRVDDANPAAGQYVEVDGPSGHALWHFVDFGGLGYQAGEASFFDGWADLTLPSAGQYWLLIRGVGWPAPWPTGPFAAAFVELVD